MMMMTIIETGLLCLRKILQQELRLTNETVTYHFYQGGSPCLEGKGGDSKSEGYEFESGAVY